MFYLHLVEYTQPDEEINGNYQRMMEKYISYLSVTSAA